ncbi:MAG: hypothetical protein RSE36_05895 [Oscillospiraceae bacterium]
MNIILLNGESNNVSSRAAIGFACGKNAMTVEDTDSVCLINTEWSTQKFPWGR